MDGVMTFHLNVGIHCVCTLYNFRAAVEEARISVFGVEVQKAGAREILLPRLLLLLYLNVKGTAVRTGPGA